MPTLAELNRWHEISTAAKDFAACARFLMLATNQKDASILADAQRSSERVRSILAKAATAVGGLTDPNWASALSEWGTAVAGFVGTLQQVSFYDRLRTGGMLPLPARSQIIVNVVAGSASVVEEGNPKPVTQFSLEGSGAMQLRKAVGICVLSQDVIRFAAGAVDFIGSQLRLAVGVATDEEFLAGLVDGISSINSTGSFLVDFQSLLGLVRTSASSRVYLAVSPTIMKQLAAMPDSDGGIAFPGLSINGGQVGGVEVVPTDGLAAAGDMVLCDATGTGGSSDTITLNGAREGSLQMDTAPDGTATNVRSLWQTNCRGVACHRYFCFDRIRDSSVSWMQNCDYSAGS